MVTIKEGNLLDAKEFVIAHGCNAQGAFNSGVAKGIRERYPIAYEEYKKITKYDNPMGKVIVAVDKEQNKVIMNCITQNKFGYDGKRYTSYQAVIDSLSKVFQACEVSESDLALPYGMCSVRGGAKWDYIYNLICMFSEEYNVNVTIYKLDLG